MRTTARGRSPWSRELRLVATCVGVLLAVAASFSFGYAARAIAEHDREVVEFCVVDEAGAQPHARPGELSFADPGSGCPAGQLLVCGTYHRPGETFEGRRSLDVEEDFVRSANC